jgi:type II secretory pathway component GspD/PulD (secretin)
MFYNANAATLYVRATDQDLETIEQKVMALSVPPPQVNIKVKFLEIAKGDTLYFLALLKDLRIQSPASSTPSPVTTPNSDLRDPLAEVITEPQFRDLLDAVKQRDGADLLNEASLTTLSGRQAQIQIADLKTIVVKINPQALVLPGVSSTNLFITQNLPLGPVLDVVPVVADDGMTVSLDVSANVSGFIGYDTPAESEEVEVYIEGKRKAMKPPRPRMRVRTLLHTAAAVPDGQTLMLGKPTDVMITYDKDGKAMREPGVEKKDLLVFLTTTLIDPTGNPVHGYQK